MIRFDRDPSSGEVVAHCLVEVGVETLAFDVEIGRWPDPDPGALHRMPVVLMGTDEWLEVARAGALRAGGQPPVLILPADGPKLGGQLLVAVEEGVEVVFLTGADGTSANLVRALRGRPIPALPLPDLEGCRSLLAGCRVDLDVPVPSLDGEARERLREAMAPLALENAHHVVEVDPRPGLDGLETWGVATAVAAAAGVLAGRLATANRRWRPP
jgi:hypothetical protein